MIGKNSQANLERGGKAFTLIGKHKNANMRKNLLVPEN